MYKVITVLVAALVVSGCAYPEVEARPKPLVVDGKEYPRGHTGVGLEYVYIGRDWQLCIEGDCKRTVELFDDSTSAPNSEPERDGGDSGGDSGGGHY